MSENDSFYGELAIIGTNGYLKTSSSCDRKQSRIALCKREAANGVKPGAVSRLTDASCSDAIKSPNTHAVSYTLSRNEVVVVEYIPDKDVDMFQIGRSTDEHIDFVVSEPNTGFAPAADVKRLIMKAEEEKETRTANAAKRSNNLPRHLATNFSRRILSNQSKRDQPPGVISPSSSKLDATDKQNQTMAADFSPSQSESTVSRFACRIHVDRKPPHTARIYAAGFDASRNIFLGERAIKWNLEQQMDGLTTNGVMILWPDRERWPSDESRPPIRSNCGHSDDPDGERINKWHEVSVCGAVYEMRKKRCVPTESNRVEAENVLVDGTLIDLCGVTLIWRSASGLAKSADLSALSSVVESLNAVQFHCPVRFQTLYIPRPRRGRANDSSGAPELLDDRRPYVYLNCGHVHGWHTWAARGDSKTADRTCPMCMQSSPFVPLSLGEETAFYVDRAPPTFCFNPCGHMASEDTVKYWCSIELPNRHNFTLNAHCPFCAASVQKEPVRLLFQGDVDQETMILMFQQQKLAEQEHPERALCATTPPLSAPLANRIAS